MQSEILQYAPYVLKNLSQLSGRPVLIVGDIGLDEYTFGHVRRISPEAPVPVLEVEREETRLGLAGNVAQNVASLGGVPQLIAVVGKDAAAEQLRGLLREAHVAPDHLVVDADRPTTRKLRVIAQSHHIVRVDYEQRRFLPAALEAQILQRVQDLLPQAAAVVVQDYAKGVISKGLVGEIVKRAHAVGKKVLADPNRNTPLDYYTGVDLMTPNYDESLALSGLGTDELRITSDHLDRVGQALMKTVGAPQMVITRGREGMRLFEQGKILDMPTFARQVADVTGAGDTVIAAMALAWGSGFSLDAACAMANFAAGVVVGKIGCVPCGAAELREYVETLQNSSAI